MPPLTVFRFHNAGDQPMFRDYDAGRVARWLLGVLCVAALAVPAAAKVQPFPPGFRTQEIKTDGPTIHVRVGGQGPAVVMLHGFGDTGDMWAPLAEAIMRDHTVVVPDLRGMGLSSHPETGYDKKTQGGDVARVLDALKIEKADLVTLVIGNTVGYALSALSPDRALRMI